MIRFIITALGAAVGFVLTVPVLLVGAPFWIVSALARALVRAIERLRPAVVPWRELVRYEPTIGWRPRPGLDAHARGSGIFHLTTDADGWRGRSTIEEADIVVFGDSFAFGHAADDRIFFADVHPELRIKAIGSNGYNMVQGLLWMERLAHRLDGKLVVWIVYYGNDLLENLRPNLGTYRMPFVRRAGGRPVDDPDEWEVVTEHVSPEPWPFVSSRDYTRRLAEICTPGPLSERVFSACGYLIRRAREVCREAGAELIVIGNPDIDQIDPDRRPRLRSLAADPDSFDARRPDRELEAICRRLDVPFVSLADHLTVRDHLPDDCHWMASGHRRVAELLGRLYTATRGRSPNGRAAREPRTQRSPEIAAP